MHDDSPPPAGSQPPPPQGIPVMPAFQDTPDGSEPPDPRGRSETVRPSDAYNPDEQGWGLGDVWMGLAVSILFQILAVTALVALTDYDATLDDTPMWLFALVSVSLHAGMLVVAIAAGEKGRGWVSDFGFRFKLRDIPQGLALGVACQIGVGLLYLPFLWALGKDLDEVGEPARELSERASDIGGDLSLMLMVGVVAPFVEEIFFRGLAFRALDKRFMRESWGRRAAIGISAVIFAAIHLQALQFPALLVLGLILGYIVHRQDRLGLAIWTHVGFNMITVISLLYLQ